MSNDYIPVNQLKSRRPRMTWEYVAAFFDGEGCLAVKWIKMRGQAPDKTKQAPVVWWMISQKNRNGLDDITKFLERFCTLTVDQHSVRVTHRKDVLFVLAMTIPYMRVKREMAIDCYRYLLQVEKLVEKYGQSYRLYSQRPAPPLSASERRRKVTDNG